jgi:DNA-binding transcriptional LysR family regulator
VETESLISLPFVVLAGPDTPLADRTKTRKALHVKELAGQPFVDWLRDDPYGGANSARFEAHGTTVREVARVESFLHLFDLLRAFRQACAIAPDLRPLHPFPPEFHVWPLQEEEPQLIEVAALWPGGALSTETRHVLQGLRRRLASKRRKTE